MVSGEELTKLVGELYKSEHSSTNDAHKLPEIGVLLSLFRTFENRLIERDFLPSPQTYGFNPLWFLGETEQNIYLWRHKSSINDANKFHFWLDVKKLASKRLAQLERRDEENPFLNPLWTQTTNGPDSIEAERHYIVELLKLFAPAEPHLTALSAVQTLVATLEPSRSERQPTPRKIIVIPTTPTQH